MNNGENGTATVRDLLKRLTDELSILFRQEMALASAEFSRSITKLLAAAASVLAGGFVLFAGFLVLLAAAVLWLAERMEPWLAALVVGVVVGVAGAVMVMAGKSKLSTTQLKPQRATESLRRDKEVLARRVT